MSDAQSISNDNNGIDANGKSLPWRLVHLLRAAQIGDISSQTDGDAEASNISSSVFDQVVTLSKILTRTYKGHDIWDAVMLLADHFQLLDPPTNSTKSS